MVQDCKRWADKRFEVIGREYEPTEHLPPREAIRRILNDKEIQSIMKGGTYKEGDDERLERYFIDFEDERNVSHILYRERKDRAGPMNDKYILYEE